MQHKIKTVIQPPSRLYFGLAQLWHYRELLYFFTWRDIKVKYKQTYLGVLWTVLQPLLLMAFFSLLFLKKFSSDSFTIAYPVHVFSGLLLWNFFQTSVSNASESILQQANIIKKIYFPRLIIPLSAVLTALFDFLISFVIFLILCVFFQQPVHWSALFFFPLALAAAAMAAVGLSCFLAALNVQFRDFRYVIPFLLQLLFFSTPVIYAANYIEQPWMRKLLALNPISGAVALFRVPLGQPFIAAEIFISLAVALLMAAGGLLYFKKSEPLFADLS